MPLLPNSTTIVGTPSPADQERIKQLEKQKDEAVKTLAGLAATAGIATPASILPFQNLIEDITAIKQQEAQRMFPGADPSLFDASRDKVYANKTTVIPLNQRIATSRVFDKNISERDINNLYKGAKFFEEYLTNQPGTPSQELGTFQQLLQNKPSLPEGSLQAITVTPGPGPSRFSDSSLESVDKLGAVLNQYEQQKRNWLAEKGDAPSPELQKQIATLRKEYTPQGGQVWGNVQKPQYGYAQRMNPSTGEYMQTTNPSLYLSRFDASPFKQADYLYTGDVQTDPRIKLNAFGGEGKTTGPSWGIRSDSSRAGRADADVNFRKDLIEARGELTTGDLQALLKAKGLPFDYQTNTLAKDSSAVLSNNLSRLAEAENITPYQAIEKYARTVPVLGEPVTPPTPATTGRISEFPTQGQVVSPFGNFTSKTDLRQLGILPPSDKASYSPFKVDEFDKLFKYGYPRYNASNIQELDTYSTPVDPLDPFGESQEGVSKLIINRDKLRPQAANKLLDKRVANLIEQSKPIQGLGLGGLAAGAIGTAMDPAVIDALARGDYQQAGTTAAVNTAVGSAVGGGTAKALQGLRAAGYARPAAIVGGGLPVAAGALAGLGIIETSEALNRAYKGQTGKDWITRNQPASPNSTYTGPTPTIKPRMGMAILNGKPVQVPYGSVAGTRTVGRPWWDKAGSGFQNLLNRFNAGSIIGR